MCLFQISKDNEDNIKHKVQKKYGNKIKNK